jgi:hypothetical protein
MMFECVRGRPQCEALAGLPLTVCYQANMVVLHLHHAPTSLIPLEHNKLDVIGTASCYTASSRSTGKNKQVNVTQGQVSQI